ncbi:MAG: hypothetical protein WA369_12300 [Candidatus Acidiferrales bacterium]
MRTFLGRIGALVQKHPDYFEPLPAADRMSQRMRIVLAQALGMRQQKPKIPEASCRYNARLDSSGGAGLGTIDGEYRPTDPNDMRMPAKRGSVWVRAAIYLGLASVLLGCGDHQERFYSTLADANKDGATDRGWVPDYVLPASVHSIHEAHELSPENEWCAFEFEPTDSEKLRENLKRVDALPPSFKRIPNSNAPWWPAVLKGDLDVANIRNAGFDVYTFERPATSVTTATYIFAIDWTKGRGYFYTD